MPEEKKKLAENKFSLEAITSVIEELSVGDVFKFPISRKGYSIIKKHIDRFYVSAYKINQVIKMPDTEKPREKNYTMVIQRIK